MTRLNFHFKTGDKHALGTVSNERRFVTVNIDPGAPEGDRTAMLEWTLGEIVKMREVIERLGPPVPAVQHLHPIDVAHLRRMFTVPRLGAESFATIRIVPDEDAPRLSK